MCLSPALLAFCSRLILSSDWKEEFVEGKQAWGFIFQCGKELRIVIHSDLKTCQTLSQKSAGLLSSSFSAETGTQQWTFSTWNTSESHHQIRQKSWTNLSSKKKGAQAQRNSKPNLGRGNSRDACYSQIGSGQSHSIGPDESTAKDQTERLLKDMSADSAFTFTCLQAPMQLHRSFLWQDKGLETSTSNKIWQFRNCQNDSSSQSTFGRSLRLIRWTYSAYVCQALPVIPPVLFAAKMPPYIHVCPCVRNIYHTAQNHFAIIGTTAGGKNWMCSVFGCLPGWIKRSEATMLTRWVILWLTQQVVNVLIRAHAEASSRTAPTWKTGSITKRPIKTHTHSLAYKMHVACKGMNLKRRIRNRECTASCFLMSFSYILTSSPLQRWSKMKGCVHWLSKRGETVCVCGHSKSRSFQALWLGSSCWIRKAQTPDFPSSDSTLESTLPPGRKNYPSLTCKTKSCDFLSLVTISNLAVHMFWLGFSTQNTTLQVA